mgnify:CR=1 FL=1
MEFLLLSESEYEKFWNNHPQKTFLSSVEIGKLREKKNWKVHYVGIKENNIFYTASFISGGFNGLCGVAAICGTFYTCHLGFHANLGWNSLTACLIAFANPFLLIPSSIILALIVTSANNFALYNNFNFDIGGTIQGIIMFIISFSIFQSNKLFFLRNKNGEKSK